MMASIPNMRSTPLPAPAPKAVPTEAMPGDFAAQMPVTSGLAQEPAPAIAPLPFDGAAPVVPDGAEATAPDESESRPEAGVETPTVELPQPAVVIPVVQAPPVVAGPHVLPTILADEGPPAQPAETQVQIPAGEPGRRTGAGVETKAGLPVAAVADPPKNSAATPELEAAIEKLLQGKREPATPAAAPAQPVSTDAAKRDAAPVPVSPPVQSTAAPAASVAVQAPVPIPAAELPQPVLAAIDAPQAPARAAATDGAPRSPDLATERQLDLARDGEWLDRLARDIARAGANDGPLRFRLHPQSLGHLHVELQQGDHGTAVRLTVETETARALLTDAHARLTAEARAQGVRITETHVDLSGSGRQAPGDQRRQDETRQTPLIRTARGAGVDAVPTARASARSRLDRYA